MWENNGVEETSGYGLSDLNQDLKEGDSQAKGWREKLYRPATILKSKVPEHYSKSIKTKQQEEIKPEVGRSEIMQGLVGHGKKSVF